MLKTTGEDLLDLVSSQIRLARVEIVEDASQGAVRALRVVVFVPVLVGGYLFAMGAAAWWLSQYWGPVVSLAAVSAVQLFVGGFGVARGLRGLKKPGAITVLDRSGTTIRESLSPGAGRASAGEDSRKVVDG